jgi:hypothetical protein
VPSISVINPKGLRRRIFLSDSRLSRRRATI